MMLAEVWASVDGMMLCVCTKAMASIMPTKNMPLMWMALYSGEFSAYAPI